MGMGFEYWEVGFERKLGWEMGLEPPFRTFTTRFSSEVTWK